MQKARRDIASVLLHIAAAEWAVAISLVFGGCCSNAWALELVTAQHPHAGTVITFAQFVLVSIYGLYKHVVILGAREAVCWRVVDEVLKVRTRRKRVGPIYMAVEGPPLDANRLADLVAHELRRAAPGLGAILFTGDAGEAFKKGRDLPSNGYLLEPKMPDDTLVIVSGDDLSIPKLWNRWDYSVFLVKSRHLDIPPERAHSSLAVDITSTMEPVILRPKGYFIPKPVFWVLLHIRLARRAIPIPRWAVQVALFLLTSLMNNAAFGYDVPMTVHIIFRSGGLVVNMLIGYLVGGRRYTTTQVISVALVTIGVACTTLSAGQSAAATQAAAFGSYFIGILLLTFALVLSGLMGLAQDRAYEEYGRGHWQEALFYLHFLALPGFAFVWQDLAAQMRMMSRGVRMRVVPGVWMPSVYLALGVNIVTQLVCVSGVHRLTSRVNSLTVALVLVVRKAVSLGISVLFGSGRGGGAYLWWGAMLVLIGTVGYTMGGSSQGVNRKNMDKTS